MQSMAVAANFIYILALFIGLVFFYKSSGGTALRDLCIAKEFYIGALVAIVISVLLSFTYDAGAFVIIFRVFTLVLAIVEIHIVNLRIKQHL